MGPHGPDGPVAQPPPRPAVGKTTSGPRRSSTGPRMPERASGQRRVGTPRARRPAGAAPAPGPHRGPAGPRAHQVVARPSSAHRLGRLGSPAQEAVGPGRPPAPPRRRPRAGPPAGRWPRAPDVTGAGRPGPGARRSAPRPRPGRRCPRPPRPPSGRRGRGRPGHRPPSASGVARTTPARTAQEGRVVVERGGAGEGQPHPPRRPPGPRSRGRRAPRGGRPRSPPGTPRRRRALGRQARRHVEEVGADPGLGGAAGALPGHPPRRGVRPARRLGHDGGRLGHLVGKGSPATDPLGQRVGREERPARAVRRPPGPGPPSRLGQQLGEARGPVPRGDGHEGGAGPEGRRRPVQVLARAHRRRGGG